MRGIFRGVCTACVLGVLAVLAAPAAADLPPYNGLTNFSTVKGPADPEEFSWQVTLLPGQELKQIDAQEAAVFYEDGHMMMSIRAEQARDTTGEAVPTSLAVADPDVVTLTVHHRAGNPAAGGAPFAYPVTAGPPFEVGPSSVIVNGPPDERQLREERERREREEAEARERTATEEAARSCLVPSLRGESLRAAKRRLRQASCGIGEVVKRAGVSARGGRVAAQHPRAGTALPVGSEVNVRLGRASVPVELR